MRELLRVIEHADYPQMIEETLGPPCIDCTEHKRDRTAGTVEGDDFSSPKIVGFYRPIPLHRFHNQSRKLRHPGADVQATAMPE
jgi:hypothetical protein